MKWRDHCRPIIAKVIEEHGTKDMKVLRRALREAYPYGERKNHPYKIWCSEINKQLGKKTHSPDMALFTKQVNTAALGIVICVLVAIVACGCMTTSSHYETSVTDPDGSVRTTYVHHSTSAFACDLSKVKVDLKLKDIGSLEVLGSVAEAQKIEDMIPTAAAWVGKAGL